MKWITVFTAFLPWFLFSCGVGQGRVSGLRNSEPLETEALEVRSVQSIPLPPFPSYLTLAVVEQHTLPERLIQDPLSRPLGKLRAWVEGSQYHARYETHETPSFQSKNWEEAPAQTLAYLALFSSGYAAIVIADTAENRAFIQSQTQSKVLHQIPGHRQGVIIPAGTMLAPKVECDVWESCLVTSPFGVEGQRQTRMHLDEVLRGYPEFRAGPYLAPRMAETIVTRKKQVLAYEIRLAPGLNKTPRQTLRILF